jgi:hypothetical protein
MRIRLVLFIIVFFFLAFLVASKEVSACEACTIPNLGRHEGITVSESKDKKWFFKYLYEQQDWDEIPASEAHELHEDGHHIHDKTKEEFHHFSLGGKLTDQLTVYTDIPYVIRNSIEIEDHDRLGANEKSEGIGDLNVIGDYRFFQDDQSSAGFVGGVKFPTGETDEKNSAGTRFEPELQPGTGSYDYILGGIYQYQKDRFKFLGNLAYVFKTEGDQDYEFGDLLSSSLFFDYLINPNSRSFKTEIGLNANFQHEQKHEDHGSSVKDSGGTTFLLGPLVSIEAMPNTSLFGSILFPVHQDLGGVHQELDYTWTAGGKLAF